MPDGEVVRVLQPAKVQFYGVTLACCTTSRQSNELHRDGVGMTKALKFAKLWERLSPISALC